MKQLNVTINLSESEIITLGNWASVGRTLSNALSVAQGEGDPEILISELRQLNSPLSNIASKIRSEIWILQQPQLEDAMNKYKRNELTDQQFEDELVNIGWWRWKAKQYIKENGAFLKEERI